MKERAINITKYATMIIDNNDEVAEKTITLFKDVGRKIARDNYIHHNMCGILRINNVRNGFIAYDFKDYTHNYSLNDSIYTNPSLPSGLDIKIFKEGKLVESKSVMIDGNFKQIMGNAVIYTFNYEYSIDIEIHFMFGYGINKYRTGTTPESCHCCCSKCSGGDPIYEYSSIYDYIDLKVTYNQSGVGEELFHRIVSEFNEFEEEPGEHIYRREYELGDIDFRLVDAGINENKAIDFSFFDTEWDPNNPDIDDPDGDYKDGPCKRYRAIGTILREDIQEFRDNTIGELPEDPYENVIVTKDNIKDSDIFKRVSFDSSTQQICNVNTYNIMNIYEENKNVSAILKIYVTRIDKETKLIVEYNFKVPNVNGIGNDRLRFKSKIDIGLNFKLK